MKKNILFMLMVVLLIVVGFGSFLAGRNHASGVEIGTDRTFSSQNIGYPEYAGMCMLKELLPYAVYKECVLPHVEKLFAHEKISKKDFMEFQQNVDKSLEEKGYLVRQLVSHYAREESFSDSFQSNIDKFNEDALKMGKGMKQGIENFMKGLTEEPSASPQNPTPPSTEL